MAKQPVQSIRNTLSEERRLYADITMASVQFVYVANAEDRSKEQRRVEVSSKDELEQSE